jgi:hypothetical membrane protein
MKKNSKKINDSIKGEVQVENPKNFFVKNYPLIGVIIFLVSIILAIINYNNYDFFNQVLSQLGVGKSAIFFNTGLFLTGLFLIPFYKKMYSKTILSKLTSITGFFSAISLIGVGAFPLTNPIMHFLFAASFFILSATTILLYTINELKQTHIFQNKENTLRISLLVGRVVVIVVVQILISLTILTYMFVLRTPIMQKIAVFVIIVWITLVYFTKRTDY